MFVENPESDFHMTYDWNITPVPEMIKISMNETVKAKEKVLSLLCFARHLRDAKS